MTRGERALFHVANVLVAGTGLVYAWMLYALAPQDEYALVNHPLQCDVQHAHVLAAPLLVLALGVLWRAHAAPQLRSAARTRRASGLALLALALPMVFSGYAISVASEPAWRAGWVIVHVATSALWTLGVAVHLLGRRARSAHQAAVAATAASASTEPRSRRKRGAPVKLVT